MENCGRSENLFFGFVSSTKYETGPYCPDPARLPLHLLGCKCSTFAIYKAEFSLSALLQERERVPAGLESSKILALSIERDNLRDVLAAARESERERAGLPAGRRAGESWCGSPT